MFLRRYRNSRATYSQCPQERGMLTRQFLQTVGVEGCGRSQSTRGLQGWGRGREIGAHAPGAWERVTGVFRMQPRSPEVECSFHTGGILEGAKAGGVLLVPINRSAWLDVPLAHKTHKEVMHVTFLGKR